MTVHPEVQRAVLYAKNQIGKQYVFGTAGPETFDCSGLTLAAWRTAGYSLPHNALAQCQMLWHPRKYGHSPAIGDIVFYYHPISHCAIIVGKDDDGKFQVVQASNPELGVVHTAIDAYAPAVAFGRVQYPGYQEV